MDNGTLNGRGTEHGVGDGFEGGGAMSLERAERLVEEHGRDRLGRLELFWRYYRNELESPGLGHSLDERVGGRRVGGGYGLAQERGLPGRFRGSWMGDDRAAEKEVVIENDIAWRVHAMVDFMFGRPVRIQSQAGSAGRRGEIERVCELLWESSGGISLMQDMALLGHVFGHVDVLVRSGVSGGRFGYGGVRFEIVEPRRGVALVSEHDYREIEGYVVIGERGAHEDELERGGERERDRGRFARWLRRHEGHGLVGVGGDPGTVRVLEVFGRGVRRVYEDFGGGYELVEEGGLGVTGEVPVVHIQNVSQPFRYEGLGEVEPLIPLQDELNTRLSDRASRVTMQSFKMLLAKGLDGLDGMSVGPGQVLQTDNPEASIEAFGGDGSSPSEDAHIEQVREALDKTSGVPPLATGVVRARVGNLSSENALRLTLTGLLSRTERKRVMYGRGIADATRMALAALDEAGVFSTVEEEREVRVVWPESIPSDERVRLANARAKLDLGVDRDRVLSELGYGPGDDGVV